MTDPVDTDALRDMGEALTKDGHIFGPRVIAAANEVDRLRAVDEFGMNGLVKAAADEWFDECAPSNVSMDDLNLIVHMITEKLNGGKP